MKHSATTVTGAAADRDAPDAWLNFQVHLGAFSSGECDRLVVLGESAADSETEHGGIEGLGDSGELRRSGVAWIPRSGVSEWAYDRVEALAFEANRLWGLDLDGVCEELQYTVYDTAGAHYTWHHDGLERGVEDRKVSVVVQLDDPEGYEGADLEFLEVASDYDEAALAHYREQVRARGTAVTFCAFEYHRVTPLRSGQRRSLVAWVSGPPLR